VNEWRAAAPATHAALLRSGSVTEEDFATCRAFILNVAQRAPPNTLVRRAAAWGRLARDAT
jgi:hypothetical protein